MAACAVLVLVEVSVVDRRQWIKMIAVVYTVHRSAAVIVIVTRIARQLTCRVPHSRRRGGLVVTTGGRTVTERPVTYRRRFTVGHRTAEVHRAVDVRRYVSRRVTLRAKRRLVLQVLIVSVTRHASRIVTVTLVAVGDGRVIPRVAARPGSTRALIDTVVVARVRTAGSKTARRKIKLTRVLGRDRSAAYLNSTVKNGRCRTSDKVRVGRVVRMASRTIDRQTERVCSRVVRTMTACRRRITVTERTVTCRTRIPVSQCARIGRIVTVRRRTRVVRRAGTVNETVSTSTSVMSTVVNFGVKTRRVHISVTLGKDPQRVRTRIICIVMIKRTRASRLNARMTVSTLKISSYMSVMGARTRGITVTRGTVET